MSDANYVGSIVKILEPPRTKNIKNKISITKFRAQIPQLRKTPVVEIIIWGNLAADVVKYYNKNDYILVEGYLSLDNLFLQNSNRKVLKRVKFTILKVHPFLFSANSKI